jgi:DNA-binding NarL/FixJ family response regulator
MLLAASSEGPAGGGPFGVDPRRPEREEGTRQDAGAPAGAEPSRVQRFRVVVADDYDDIRALVRTQLEVSGRFEVVGEAANGQQAVNLVARHRPDVIILDLVMPVLSGLEAVPLIRRASPATRVLAFTGFPERLIDWPALGLDGVITKGASVAELVQAVLDLLAPED